MKYKLYYDGNCPVCTNYVKLLRKKLNPTKIECIATTTDATEFKLVTPDGRTFNGEQAIEKLAERFPKVKNFFWMLPERYKVKALKVAYKVGGAVRKIIKKKGGCGCGGKRK